MFRKPPLVSILTVSNRPDFGAWISWNVRKQTYARTEWILVTDTGGAPVGELRNAALKKADGDYVIWFDDDDWQNPKKIEWLVALADKHNAPYVGWQPGMFMNLDGRGEPFVGGSKIQFASAIFRADIARSVTFDALPKCSDTRWVRTLVQRNGDGKRLRDVRDGDPITLRDTRMHTLWLCHGRNMHHRPYAFSAPLPLDDETQKQLEHLRQRLGQEHTE